MTNLSEQTVFTPAAKNGENISSGNTLKPRLKFIPSLIWTRGIKMHTYFLDLQNIFLFAPHLFELRKLFCTPCRVKKIKKPLNPLGIERKISNRRILNRQSRLCLKYMYLYLQFKKIKISSKYFVL